MRMPFRQITDADCNASPSEVLTDQDIFDKVKITDPYSKSDSDDEPHKLIYQLFLSSSLLLTLLLIFRTRQTNDRSRNQQVFQHSEILFQSTQNSRKQKNINDLFQKKKNK